MSVFQFHFQMSFQNQISVFQLYFLYYIYQLQPIREPITELTTDNLATILIVEQYLVTPASCG